MIKVEECGIIVSALSIMVLSLAGGDQWTEAHIHVKLHLWFFHIPFPFYYLK